MFIDARTISANSTITADVCIVGAGAAGISIARELAGSATEVCLLESGGLEYDLDTQQLYRGASVGFPYFPLEVARLRFFGGTTNHWGGAARPLDEVDFLARDWVPYSGWPFGRSGLDPFYERAQALLELGPFAYDSQTWATDERRPARFSDDTLRNAVLQQSPPTRFGQAYREELRRAPNVRTYLNANVLEIETAPEGRRVTRLRVASLERNEFFVSARIYVLAAGGIENPRLLLLSARTNPAGLGNDHDLVGRFFMDHPIAGWGKPGVVAPLRFPLRFYAERGHGELLVDGTRKAAELWGFITPSEGALRRERMLNWGIAARRAPKPEPDGVKSARHIRKSLRQLEWPDELWSHVTSMMSDFDHVAERGWYEITGQERPAERIELMYWAEPQPNPESRVTLSGDRDFFGQRRVALDWRLSERDLRNMQQALELLGIELGKAGIGRLRIDPAVAHGDMRALFEASFHHVGTTRMHRDPQQGVVDADCRVHGVSNLYVAGSSVFPTAGHANPTLTIVALALRLADHVQAQLTRAETVAG